MKKNNYPQRKQNRLKYYNYAKSGAYFITICSKGKKCIFAKIVGDGSTVPIKTNLSKLGKIINEHIIQINKKYPAFFIDNFVIMPNHIHILLSLADSGTANPSPTISDVIAWLKYKTSQKANATIWQRSFHDHVIRNQSAYQKIYQYIQENHLRWQSDRYYSSNEEECVFAKAVGDGSTVPIKINLAEGEEDGK